MGLATFEPVCTDRLTVRPIDAADLGDLFDVNGDETVTRFLPYPTWASADDGAAWLTRMQALTATGTARQLVVERRRDGKVIGTVLLFKHDAGSARLEIGYVIGSAHWRQGYAREALQAVCAQAFGPLGIRRIEAEVNPANTASDALLQSLGFVLEGRLRQRWIAKGQTYDTLLYGCLVDEWRPRSADRPRNTPMPAPADGPSDISPSLTYDDAPAAIDWLCRAFGFRRRFVVPGEGGRIEHSELTLGNGVVMIGSPKAEDRRMSPKALAGVAQALSVYVPDPDAHHATSVAAGARVVRPLRTEDYGARGYMVSDLEGHLWYFGNYRPGAYWDRPDEHPVSGPATLRQATRADIPGIWAVRYGVRENTLRRGLISDEDVRREIEDTGRGWVVTAGEDDQVVAFAIGHAGTGNIWALFVLPDHEGRGHGSRLHTVMVDWLWAQGLPRLWLTTGPGTRAQGFYERRGWRAVGEIANGDLRYELERPPGIG